LGHRCSSNKLITPCYHNSFGNNCSSNTLDALCCNNTFGDSCSFNTFNKFLTNNIFEGYNEYLNITNPSSSASNEIKNIKVSAGLSGTSDTEKLTITPPLNSATQVVYNKIVDGIAVNELQEALGDLSSVLDTITALTEEILGNEPNTVGEDNYISGGND
jgi:hypothetical protein